MYYLMWRVLTGLHNEIKISFLPVGHTKFSPDWCFGLLKQQHKKTTNDCLDDSVAAVNKSTTPNVAQLVGTQDGSSVVNMYNWAKHYEQYTIKTASKGIQQMHHFWFTSAHPGKLFIKNTVSENEKN